MTYIAITADASHIRKVRRSLRRAGHDAYLPALVAKKLYAKGGRLRRKRRVVPLMSYIFVKAPHDSVLNLWLHAIVSTKDVRGYIKSSDGPALIPDQHIEALRDSVDRMRFEAEAARYRRKLRKGGKAAIKSGSLAGTTGTVEWVRNARIGLEARLFGGLRVIEVAAENLEAA